MATCQVCGKEYDVDNLVRTQGNVLWRATYCSARCYTKATCQGRCGAVGGKHTPAPWQAISPTQSGHKQWKVSPTSGTCGPYNTRIATINNKRPSEYQEANAYLIAAVPEMKEACELMHSDLSGDGLIRLETKAAIVKALRKAKPNEVIHVATQRKAEIK